MVWYFSTILNPISGTAGVAIPIQLKMKREVTLGLKPGPLYQYDRAIFFLFGKAKKRIGSHKKIGSVGKQQTNIILMLALHDRIKHTFNNLNSVSTYPFLA